MRVPEADNKFFNPKEVVITCSEVLGSDLLTYVSSTADIVYIAKTHSYSDTVSLPDVKFTPSWISLQSFRNKKLQYVKVVATGAGPDDKFSIPTRTGFLIPLSRPDGTLDSSFSHLMETGNKCGTLAGKEIWPRISTRATVQETWSYSSNSHLSSQLGFYYIGKFTFPGAKFPKMTIGFVISVRLSVRAYACNNSAPTGRIFIKFNIWAFFETLSRKSHIKGTLHTQQYTILNTSLSVLLRIRHISDKKFRENQNAFYVRQLFFSENRAVNETM